MNLDMMGVGKKKNMYQESQISIGCIRLVGISTCN